MSSNIDFIHCNHCFAQTSISDNNYYLTQCARIYCQQCINQFSRNCLKCDQNQCQSVFLANAIKSEEIHAYFRDASIAQTLKHSKLIETLEKVDEFQRTQRKNLIDGLNKQLFETKRENNKLINDLIAVKSENESLKNMMQNRNQLISPKSNMSSDDSLKQKFNETNISFKSLFDFNSHNASQTVGETMPMSPASNNSSISLVSSSYRMNAQNKPQTASSINSRITLSSSRKNDWKSNNASQQLTHSLFNAYTPSSASSRSNSTITSASSLMANNRFGSNNRFVSSMRPKLTRTVFPFNK